LTLLGTENSVHLVVYTSKNKFIVKNIFAVLPSSGLNKISTVFYIHNFKESTVCCHIYVPVLPIQLVSRILAVYSDILYHIL